jgi:DnaK suppressor protein
MAGKKLTPKEFEEFEEHLRQMLAVLNGDIRNLESEAFKDGRSNVSAEDVGSELSAVELSLDLLGRDENTVLEIMDALDRIKSKTFGICAGCKKQIKKTRLKYMPHARHCIECQRLHEERPS